MPSRKNCGPGRFAIFVHPQARRQGIGRALLLKMIRYCAGRGFSEIIGQIAPENERMLALARSAGMHIHRAPGAGIAVAHLKLPEPAHVANSTNADSATRPAMKMTAPRLRRRTLGVGRSSGRSAYEGFESQE